MLGEALPSVTAFCIPVTWAYRVGYKHELLEQGMCHALCKLPEPRTMPGVQSVLDQRSGLKDSMGSRGQFNPSEGSNAYNQFRNIWAYKTFCPMLCTSLLSPVLASRFFTTSAIWEDLCDLYMSFISNESFAEKQMLAWKCIFLSWKDSNFFE